MEWMTELIKQIGKTIRGLPKPVLIIVSSIFTLMCYWFIAIYFVSPQYLQKLPLWISIILCFVLSVSWFIMNVLILSALVLVIQFAAGSSANIDVNENDRLIGALLNSLVYLSLIIFISIYFHFRFYHFLFACSLYLIGAFLYLLIVILRTFRERRKKTEIERLLRDQQ